MGETAKKRQMFGDEKEKAEYFKRAYEMICKRLEEIRTNYSMKEEKVYSIFGEVQEKIVAGEKKSDIIAYLDNAHGIEYEDAIWLVSSAIIVVKQLPREYREYPCKKL